MKKGDKVSLKGKEYITGIISDTRRTIVWGLCYNQHLVKHDDPELCPLEDWYEEELLVEVLPEGISKFTIKCECGVSIVMSNGKHSDYCPLYRKY